MISIYEDTKEYLKAAMQGKYTLKIIDDSDGEPEMFFGYNHQGLFCVFYSVGSEWCKRNLNEEEFAKVIAYRMLQ